MIHSNKVEGLLKQNDSIFSSLIAKNIEFNRYDISNIDSEEEILKILSEENSKLKDIVKLNKPLQVKEQKEQKEKPKEQKEQKEQKEDEEQKEETYEEPVKKFSIITNMEDIKRAFFNKEYELFESLLKVHNFRYFTGIYKYSSDKDNAPEFMAKNLVKGFVRNLDDYRKYLLASFRCIKHENNTYTYPSLWILNSNNELKDILDDIYEDFIFEEVNINEYFLGDFKKIDFDVRPDVLDESYLH